MFYQRCINVALNIALLKEHSSAKFSEIQTIMKLRFKVRLAKQDIFVKGAHSGCRSFWKHVKQYTGFGKLKVFLHPWPDANPVVALHSANKLNNYLIETINNLKCKFQSASSPYKSECSRCSSAAEPIFRTIIAADTIKAFSRLSNSASSDNDGITVSIVKMSAKVPALVNALTDIFNTLIINFNFPFAWKELYINLVKYMIRTTIDQSLCFLS